MSVMKQSPEVAQMDAVDRLGIAIKRIEWIRKKVHDRAFACDEAADDELQSNGKTDVWQTLREEAQWLHALLVEIGGQ